MNFDKMGIAVTMIVLVGILGVAAISSGEFGLEINTDTDKKIIQQYTSSTSTDTSKYAYYEWCYQMGKTDC